LSETSRFGPIIAGNDGTGIPIAAFGTPQFTGQGLELGAGSIVARALTDQYGATRLDLDKDFERAGALLSVAYHRPIGAWEMERLQAASDAWAKNDLTLAHTILAQARLGWLEEAEDAAERLRTAEKFLSEGTAPWELLKSLDLLADDLPLGKASPDDPEHPGWPAGTPGGLGGEFEPKNGTANQSGNNVPMGHNQGPPPPPPPKIPPELPSDGHIRSEIIKAAVKWLIRAGLLAADITAPEAVIAAELGIEVGSWAYPYIKSYFDAPKSLQELQEAANDPEQGYQIHHIVEQKAARKEKFSEDQIEGPDNLVRIPTLKHWQLTGWFQSRSGKFRFRNKELSIFGA
jgi:hypothetical protein